VIGLLGLWDRADAYPGQLSGGELARAGPAIALANRPSHMTSDPFRGRKMSSPITAHGATSVASLFYKAGSVTDEC